MALGLRDKIKIRKEIKANLEKSKGDISFRDRVKLKKEINAAFKKLKIKAEENDHDNENLKKLIAGDFNDKTPSEFLAVMEDIVDEIGGDIERVKEPAINYINANQDLIQA